jgi:hypothetical protein
LRPRSKYRDEIEEQIAIVPDRAFKPKLMSAPAWDAGAAITKASPTNEAPKSP